MTCILYHASCICYSKPIWHRHNYCISHPTPDVWFLVPAPVAASPKPLPNQGTSRWTIIAYLSETAAPGNLKQKFPAGGA